MAQQEKVVFCIMGSRRNIVITVGTIYKNSFMNVLYQLDLITWSTQFRPDYLGNKQ